MMVREVHRHDSSRAKGVGANLAWFEAKFIFSQDKGDRAQCSVYACTRDAADLAPGAGKGVKDGVVGSPFFVAEALDNRRCLEDWAHDVVVGAEQRDRLHAVAICLVPEYHQDEVGFVREQWSCAMKALLRKI